MKKEPGFIYRVFLVIGDSLAIILAFSGAYYFRVHFDPRPFYFEADTKAFIAANMSLVPIWLMVLAGLGLYSKDIIRTRTRQYFRLFLASVIGMMTIISFDYFTRAGLFPVRTVALYEIALCFILLSIFRAFIRLFRRILFRHRHGLLRTIIIGNNDNTTQFLEGLDPESGYAVVGVIARNQYIPEEWRKDKYNSLTKAIAATNPDVIIQTDDENVEENNQAAINCHARFYYALSDRSIISHSASAELLAAIPVIPINPTPLVGGMRFFKRVCDLLLGIFAFIVASPIMLIIFLIEKISEPGSPAIYRDIRLSRYNTKFPLYKFRSIKVKYCGTPEQAFTKMGRPELIEEYRANGDYLKNDPRYTKLGLFLRRTSLDELPQLINIIRGDISFVGPRALEPHELKNFNNKGLLLSVKSGLTGLAQVSGRRNISFDERRALDIYYIQHYTPLLDLKIILQTIGIVIGGRGAK